MGRDPSSWSHPASLTVSLGHAGCSPLFTWGRGLPNYIPLCSHGNEFGFSERTPAGWGEAAQKAAGWGREEKGEGGEEDRPR